MTDIRWIAGFFDGEGSVGIYPNGRGHYHLRTQVTQRWTPASVEVANLLRSRFGGNFSLQRSGNGHAKWNWQLNSRKACTFLCAIWPHVKLKRSQIAVAINFMENGMSGNYACQKLKRLKRSGA